MHYQEVTVGCDTRSEGLEKILVGSQDQDDIED